MEVGSIIIVKIEPSAYWEPEEDRRDHLTSQPAFCMPSAPKIQETYLHGRHRVFSFNGLCSKSIGSVRNLTVDQNRERPHFVFDYPLGIIPASSFQVARLFTVGRSPDPSSFHSLTLKQSHFSSLSFQLNLPMREIISLAVLFATFLASLSPIDLDCCPSLFISI